MYAFVSNECQTIVKTQRQLDLMLSIFSYPKFKRITSREDALEFFASCNRNFIKTGFKQYGKSVDASYVSVQYFIDSNNIYVNVDTRRFGYIKLPDLPRNVRQDATYDYLKLKICNIRLDDSMIAHHCLAISNILRLFGEFIDIEFILPDISVYLACTKYNGANYIIRSLQGQINNRYGRVYYTLQ